MFFGPFTGSPPGQVAAELAAFWTSLKGALDRLDAAMPDATAATPSRLNMALDDLAKHYATWLRIHPFADGNGRTARVLANWVVTRHWQPLILPGRPPADRIGLAVASTPAIANKDHRLLVVHLRKRLLTARATQQQAPGSPQR